MHLFNRAVFRIIRAQAPGERRDDPGDLKGAALAADPGF